MIKTKIIFITILLLFSGTAISKIYKWVDADGKTHFSSSPPKSGNAETVKPKANVVKTRKLPDSIRDKSKKKVTSTKKVVMYSAVWCGVCKQARRFFQKNGIPFKEYDVETSAKGRSDYKRMKARAVPIIMVGSKRLNGFDPRSFMAAYRS